MHASQVAVVRTYASTTRGGYVRAMKRDFDCGGLRSTSWREALFLILAMASFHPVCD